MPFGNATGQGFVNPGIVVANQVVIFGANDGMFLYNGSPALGNPPVSYAVGGGTTKDPYGNTLPVLSPNPQIVVTGSDGVYVQIAEFDDSAQVTLGSGAAAESLASALFAQNFTSPSPGYVEAGFFGPAVAGYPDIAEVELQSSYTDGSSYAGGNLIYKDRSGNDNILQQWSEGGLITGVPNSDNTFFEQQVYLSRADDTLFNVPGSSGTSPNRLTILWPIPANSATPGTVYRIECSGSGTQGSTQQNLSMWLEFNNIANNMLNTMAGSDIPASTAFWWKYNATVLIITTGTGGITIAEGTFTWSAQQATTGSNSATAAMGQDPLSFNTAVNSNMSVAMAWASATGSPLISCTRSKITREGGNPL
jgi:hypothetical protein